MPAFPHALPTLAGAQGDLARQLALLVGPAYQAGDDTRNAADYLALGLGLSEARASVLGLLADAFADTADDLLGEWEALYAMPARPDQTNAERRSTLGARARAGKAGTPQAIETALGLVCTAAVNVTEYTPPFPAGLETRVFRLAVVVPTADQDNEALAPTLDLLLEVAVPAHVEWVITDNDNFLCDDPGSLCFDGPVPPGPADLLGA